MVTYREAMPFLSSGLSPSDKFNALANARFSIGLSPLAKNIVLEDCVSALTSVFGRVQPSDRQGAVLKVCRDAAGEVTGAAPSSSYAWYVGALAASRAGDMTELSRGLSQSEATGPNEQWIAVLRADLAEEHRAVLDSRALAAEDRDLALLVQSQGGIAAIAARYIIQPDFRERITTIIETLSPSDQQRFLSSVKQAASLGG